MGHYFKKEIIVDIIKIFISGGAAIIIYIIFNSFLPEFTHGYITFIIPLCICAMVYGGLLLVTGVLKRLARNVNKK